MSKNMDKSSFPSSSSTSADSVTNEDASVDELLVHPIFDNEVILRHLFSVVPLTDLKTYREVCSDWRKISETEFKKRSAMNIEFPRRQTVFNKIKFETFSQQADYYFQALKKMSKGHSHVPWDTFHFNGPVTWHNAWIQEIFKQYGKQIKTLKVELRIFSPVDLITFQNIIFEYIPNLENLTITWASLTQFIMQRLLQDDDADGSLAQLKYLGTKTKTPNHLKTLSVRMMEGSMDSVYFRGVKWNFLNFLHNLISNANDLIVLDCTDSLYLPLSKFPTSCLCNLQEIKLQLLGKPSYDLINDVIKLSAGCPEIISFSIEYSKASTSFVDLEPLLRILKELNKLKKLRIYWEPSVNLTYHMPVEDPYLGDKKVLEFPAMKTLEALDISYNLLLHNSIYFGCQDWTKQLSTLKSLTFRYNVQKSVGIEHPFNVSLQNILEVNKSVTSFIFDGSQAVTLWKGYSPLEIKDLEKYFQLAKLKFPNLVNLKIIEQHDGLFKYSVHSYCGNTKDHCSFLADFKYYNTYLKAH